MTRKIRHRRFLLSQFLFVLGPITDTIEPIEQRKIRRTTLLLGKMFGRLLVPPDCRVVRWGFKETWNGSASFQYDWELYNEVFPEARFIYVIRNQFEFARSCFANDK